MTHPGDQQAGTRASAIAAWCLYDWANTAFGSVIVTFIFAVYFTQQVAVDAVTGTAQWNYATGAAGIVVALLSPMLGAIADHSGARKPWIGLFTGLTVFASLTLWFAAPTPEWVPLAMLAVAVGVIGLELATVFYNAMLHDLAPPGYTGRISGWGWGLGYLGGLGCLVTALFVLVRPEQPLWGWLDTAESEHLRATGPLVALWFTVFALPMFLMTPDRPPSGLRLGAAVTKGLRTLKETLVEVRRYTNIVRFFIASAFYRDGLATLFNVGGIYAGTTFDMDFDEIVLFAIALNVTAALGSVLFAWVDDWIGAKPTIVISLIGLIGLGVPTLLITEKSTFWLLAMGLGLFMGPAQAAGRSLLARLAPPHMMTEMFGLYSLSGKAVSFIGPWAFAVATQAFESQRAGMATILVLFAIGLTVMITVRDPR